MRGLLLGTALFSMLSPLRAQSDSLPNQLSLSLNFMTHGEVRGGGLPENENGNAAGQSKANFLMGRTRMTLDYKRTGLEARAVIQNSAIWGMKSPQALNLYEGWVKMTADCGLFAQVGRIALAYDDERIIGPNDFAMAAKSHDLLRAGYEGHGHKVHALLAYNQNSSNTFGGTYYENGSQYYKTMQTVWYHYDVPHFPLGASLLFMNVGEQAGEQEGTSGYDKNPERTVYQQLYGGYVNFHPKHLTLEGSYYRQAGDNADDKQVAPIKAWMASVKATVKPSDRYGFILGYDYLSGDDYMVVRKPGTIGMILHEVPKGFTPLYGSHTKFYGILDYFYTSAYLDDFTPGLQNSYAGAYYKPTAKLDCRATYHYMATATKLHELDKTLGHVIELQASYRFTKDVSFVAAFTQMHGTETMDRLKQNKGEKRVRWGWFSLVISPSLFTTKW
jgi:hypothetical protein